MTSRTRNSIVLLATALAAIAAFVLVEWSRV